MTTNRGWKIARLGLMTVALLLAVTFVCHAATVTGMSVKKSDDKVEIHLNASGAVNYNVTGSCEPRQALVVEMSGVSVYDQATKTVQIDKGIIERARVTRDGSGKARLTVDVLYPVGYHIKAAPGNRGFVLVMGTQPVAAKDSTAVPTVCAGEPIAIETPAPVEPPATVAADICKPYDHKDVTAKERASKAKAKSVKLVSIDFVNADLIYVLKLLAKELNVNLVTDNTVTGAVTMSLKDVPAQTAMNIIVRMNGFKMKKMGDILFVGSEETMGALTPDVIEYNPTGDVETMAIRLEYISSTDAIDTIKQTYPMVEVHSSPQGNAVVVKANCDMLLSIKDMIAGIDVPAPEGPPPIMETVEVVRLKYAQANDAVATLKAILGADAPATMEVDSRLNAIVFKGYPSQISQAKDQLEDIDLPLQQVMLSVKVVDLSVTGAKNLGINWQIGAQDGTQPIRWYEVPSDYPTSAEFNAENPYDVYQSGPPDQYGNVPIGFFIRNPFVLQSSLSLQVTNGEAKVLASPRVATMSGEEATIHIGDKYPIVYYDPRAGQYQVIYVDIGIKLTVTPTISPDGYITTEIDTTVSDLRELINNQYPRTTERSATLTIRVKDNNTIVIGGMVNESSRTNIQKVPLLGDIPILGALFKSTTVDKSKSEVVIMITPKIINQ